VSNERCSSRDSCALVCGDPAVISAHCNVIVSVSVLSVAPCDVTNSEVSGQLSGNHVSTM
jgi:hypothetical protein